MITERQLLTQVTRSGERASLTKAALIYTKNFVIVSFSLQHES